MDWWQKVELLYVSLCCCAGPDAGTPGQPKADAPKLEAPKLEAPKIEAPKLPKIEAPKIEAPKLPKIEVPKAEAPKLPKVEAPKLDVPKPPKVEAPKLEVPKPPSIPTPQTPALPQQEGKAFPYVCRIWHVFCRDIWAQSGYLQLHGAHWRWASAFIMNARHECQPFLKMFRHVKSTGRHCKFFPDSALDYGICIDALSYSELKVKL